MSTVAQPLFALLTPSGQLEDFPLKCISSKNRSKWYQVHVEREDQYDVVVMLNACDIEWTERAIVTRLLNEGHRVNIPQTRDFHVVEQ